MVFCCCLLQVVGLGKTSLLHSEQFCTFVSSVDSHVSVHCVALSEMWT